MNRIAVLAFLSACGVAAPIAAAADDEGRGQGKRWAEHDRGDERHRYGMPPGQAKKLWRRGERIPMVYLSARYVIVEPQRYRLVRPKRGFHWVMVDGDAYLVGVATGVIIDAVTSPRPFAASAHPRFDRREELWRKRYQRSFTYADDSFYTECKTSVNPVGVLSGAAIGGLLGNAAGEGRGKAGATVAGVILGGAVGAALTSELDCNDRDYAYRTYSEGLNAGRPNGVYRWRNPASGRQGEFTVASYYDDPDGFRCARYTQKIFVEGQPEASSGIACQQPDGTWTIVR